MRIFCLLQLLMLQGGAGGAIGLLPALIIVAAIILVVVAIRKRGARRDVIADGKEAVSESSALMKPYRDAYLVAKATATIGEVIKGIGILVAALGLIVAAQSGSTGTALVIVLVPAFAGALIYCVGVLVAAQGQILLATLDTAVNSSPFLNNEDKAKAMSL